MLTKIIAVKNVGRFRNSAASGNQQLARHTFIAGANGFGKTTLCAVLRSFQSGDASHILGRTTLGVTAAPTVDLLTAKGAVRFDGETWSATQANIAIFDGVFVAENVHSGEVVDIAQKRNLYRVIVGDDGVRLANEDAELAAESRAKTGEVTTATNAIQPHIPAGMGLDAFLKLAVDPVIDAKIMAQERSLDAARQTAAIKARRSLCAYTLPALPAGLIELLGETIDGIAQDAEQRFWAHLARHRFEDEGAAWLADGIEHSTDSCPFCGQALDGLALIAAYRAIFSDTYKTSAIARAAAREAINTFLGEAALARLDVIATENAAGIEYWEKFCNFAPTSTALPTGLASAAKKLKFAATALLDAKEAAPLTAIVPDERFKAAVHTFDIEASALAVANNAIGVANDVIANKKAETEAADVPAAEAELARLKAIKTRHTVAVAALCATHTDSIAAKKAIDARKTVVRARLNTHTASVIVPYERRINHLLQSFNAGFAIAKTAHTYPGGIATSTYQIVINETGVDVGDGKTPANQPSFKNTLSAGDRATLALAFFLAHLERDPALTDKIVVFDDPFSSQDAFRRRQTVHEIARIARDDGGCGQVILLSHDAAFLKQVWDKVPASSRVALGISDHRAQGSKLSVMDLEAACRGRTASDMDDLQAYLTTGAGSLLDIIRKMRVVLETYCQTTYPAAFLATDWLGDMVRKIREVGAEHPAVALYDELDQINGYTSQYHHGEDTSDTTPDQIDGTELTGYAQRTLKITNALQA